MYSCIDRYDFVIKKEKQGIVVEGFITDKSYYNTRVDYPSEGRFFTIKLSESSDVTNTRGKAITNAKIKLISDQNEIMQYTESSLEKGTYELRNNSFKALPEIKYSLLIEMDDATIQSAFISLPQEQTCINEITFEESVLEKYVYKSEDEREIKKLNGINLNIKTPTKEDKEYSYYRWNLKPLWVYIAPEADINSIYKKCWVTSSNYLSGFHIFRDKKGNVDETISFIQTKENEKVYEYFDVLIKQYALNQGFYNFCNDLLKNQRTGGLYEQLPYNVETNYKVISGKDYNVIGYFEVANENAVRWTFDINQLSYGINNNLAELCKIKYGPPIPGELDQCEQCTAYNGGKAIISPPWWW